VVVRQDHRDSLRIRRYLELFRISDHDLIGSTQLLAIEYFSRMNEQGIDLQMKWRSIRVVDRRAQLFEKRS